MACVIPDLSVFYLLSLAVLTVCPESHPLFLFFPLAPPTVLVWSEKKHFDTHICVVIVVVLVLVKRHFFFCLV